MIGAVAQLQKGLDLLAVLPDGRSRQQQELDLRISLAQAQTATRGLAAIEARENYDRARLLAEQWDPPDYLFGLLYGQCLFHLMRAEHKLALLCAERMEKIGKERNNLTMVLGGRLWQAVTYFNRGELVAAQMLYEQCESLSEP